MRGRPTGRASVPTTRAVVRSAARRHSSHVVDSRVSSSDPSAPAPVPAAPKVRRKTWRERLDSGAEDESERAEEPAVDREHHARQE